MDNEERFRSARLDSRQEPNQTGQLYGQFDPRTLVLLLRKDLASALDTKGGALPHYSVEFGPTAAQRSYSTHLHETIHYWQSVGSTSGFMNSLGDATAIFRALDDLKSARHRRKPILRTLPDNASSDDPAFRACLTWSDIDHGCAMLDDPGRAVGLLEENWGSFVSVGQSLLSLCAHTAFSLSTSFDNRSIGLIDASSWFDQYEEFVSRGEFGFETDSLLSIPLGLRDISEGQARLSELQHRDLTQQPLSWSEVKHAGWLSGIYGNAFNVYLENSGIAEPESSRDDSVNLFLLLCDIAINPAVGYADSVDASRHFVLDFHPGARFLRLCRAAAKMPDLLHDVELPSLKGYETLCRRLCNRFEWKTPTEVAETVLGRWSRAFSGDELADQHHSREYGADDVHRRFFIGEHRNFLESRTQIPHFFCWPAWQHLIFEESPEYAAVVDEMLGWHRPPFTAEEGRGVTTVEIPRMSPDEQGSFLSRYFTMHGLYDLTRQWIAKPRAFLWNRFEWKQPLTSRDVEWFKDRFVATFGIQIDDIEDT